MTENEKLIVEMADALTHLDGRITVFGNNKAVKVQGTIPESIWDAIHKAADRIKSNELEGQAARTESSTIAALEARLAALEKRASEEQIRATAMDAFTDCMIDEDSFKDHVREIAQEVVTDYLKDEDSWKDYLHDLVSKCVDDVDLDSYVATYLRDKGYVTNGRMIEWVTQYVSGRISDVEDEGAFQNNVELALVNIIEGSYKTPDNFANFHRKVAALLKYHFGKLARSQS